MSNFRYFSDGQGQVKAPVKSNFVHTCNLLSRYIKEKGSLRDLNLEIGGKVESLETIVKTGSSHAAPDSATMNLLTNIGKSAEPLPVEPNSQPARPDSSVIVIEDASNKASTSKEGATPEMKTAQLTLFYAGRVLVFYDYPADKAREVVSFAKRGSSQMSYGIFSDASIGKPSHSTSVTLISGTREGLPPHPQAGGSSKKSVGISSNTCKEKMNPSPTGAVASSSGAQEGSSLQPEGNGSELPIARRSSLHRFLEKRKDRAAARGPYQVQEQPASSSKGDDQLDLNL